MSLRTIVSAAISQYRLLHHYVPHNDNNVIYRFLNMFVNLNCNFSLFINKIELATAAITKILPSPLSKVNRYFGLPIVFERKVKTENAKTNNNKMLPSLNFSLRKKCKSRKNIRIKRIVKTSSFPKTNHVPKEKIRDPTLTPKEIAPKNESENISKILSITDIFLTPQISNNPVIRPATAPKRDNPG